MEIATILVAASFGAVLSGLMQLLKSWLTRHNRLVLQLKLPSGGRTTFSTAGATPAEVSRLIERALLAQNDVDASLQLLHDSALLANAHLLLSQPSGMGLGEEENAIVSELQQLLEREPKNKRAAITLSRYEVERAAGDRADRLRRAIAILNAFVAAKRDANQIDSDYASGLYNLACYETLMYDLFKKEARPTNELENHRNEAMRLLQESISVSPENATDAASDPDFVQLREDPAFQAAISVRA